MHLSILAVVIALTASIFVGACVLEGEACRNKIDCCNNKNCRAINDIYVSRLLCNHDSTMTHLSALGLGTSFVPLMVKVEAAAQAVCHDSKSCFCLRFFIVVDGAIPSSEPIDTVSFGQIFILLDNLDV
ncbi:uncharacterized protein EDB93DRAFT_1161950 [Suillus bovinus]|uniref:uncharacterized protein n=1 Tax=Suillus bovinus TaxID=48563 RepID=UPI001B85C19C|nr:uncharacterized protein EDB93DRAFT_1161950 [Suillus bovinus]KAG2140213.1 hypothetical protein EDB93DRAFT_1161950 [Suillus bovinus]